MNAPLTREEVLAWPPLGPMALKAERVLALLDERDAAIRERNEARDAANGAEETAHVYRLARDHADAEAAKHAQRAIDAWKERDAALARAEKAEAQVAALREALADFCHRMSKGDKSKNCEDHEVCQAWDENGLCLWCRMVPIQHRSAALRDTEAAAKAHDERVQDETRDAADRHWVTLMESFPIGGESHPADPHANAIDCRDARVRAKALADVDAELAQAARRSAMLEQRLVEISNIARTALRSST